VANFSPWMHCIIKIDGLIFVSTFAWQLNFICDVRQFWQMCCLSFLLVWETKVHLSGCFLANGIVFLSNKILANKVNFIYVVIYGECTNVANRKLKVTNTTKLSIQAHKQGLIFK
jgi:hypothetical protein